MLEEGSNSGRCAHGPLDEAGRNKPWLKKESPAHKALAKSFWINGFLIQSHI